MNPFTKIIRPGTTETSRGRRASVYIKIELDTAGELHITGVVGPLPSGNAVGSCGQIDMNPPEIKRFAPGFTEAMYNKLMEIWGRWHLNHLLAGTPAQMDCIRNTPKPEGYYDHYQWAKNTLQAANLDPDNGYEYGSAWLKEDLPKEIADWLISLPDTDKTPAWV